MITKTSFISINNVFSSLPQFENRIFCIIRVKLVKFLDSAKQSLGIVALH